MKQTTCKKKLVFGVAKLWTAWVQRLQCVENEMGKSCTRFKAAKRLANKSGSGGNKFLSYDIMNAEVGMRPRFTCKALIDTSASSKIQKVNVPRGNPPRKVNPAGDVNSQ